MSFDKVKKNLIKNRERRLNDELIAIPWKSLPRLSKVIPGIQQAKYIVLSAGPKAGKSQLCDFLFLYEPINWFLENRAKENVRLKVLYFSLEMSREAKLLQATSYKLNKDFGISISPEHLKSTFEDYILEPHILETIMSTEFQSWMNEFESIVQLIDNVRSPDEIHKTVLEYAEEKGRFEKKGGNLEYISDDPDEYVIVIVDHLSLLAPDKGKLFDAIYDYSAHKCLFYRDKLKYCVVNVQQQSADSTTQQFDYRGYSIIDKIRPKPEGLADCKYTSRDADLMLSLFNPTAYNFEEYEGVNLNKIGRWHRELFINLNRSGISNAMVQLYFNGAVNEFFELPRKLRNEDYEHILNKANSLIT